MKHIALQYPRLWRYWIRTIHTTHPDKWEELTPDQMVAIGRLINDDISEEECLQVMLRVSRKVVRKLDEWQRYNLGCLLAFLQQQTPHNRFIIPNIGVYHAPADNLSDITLEEFMIADTFFADYIETGDRRKLAVMVACLYRMKPPGHKRLPFDEDACEQWADELTTHGHAVLEAVAVNYGLIRQWLQKSYPHVFPESSDDGDKPRKGKVNGGWLDVFDALVGDKREFEDVFKQKRAMNELRYMNRKIKEQRKKRR